MTGWLHTVRWKNLIIIWVSILVIIIPHFNIQRIYLYYEFILWAIICSSIAAIGNITNDLLDVKQDRENKKKNIFVGGRNRLKAWFLIFFLLIVCVLALFNSNYFELFSMIAGGSLILLLFYNFLLKKWILIGNIVIALLTGLIFVGVDLIVLSRLSYFQQGLDNKQIELLACFAIITTLIREILKDAEDRKGDQFAGFHTIARFLPDRWIALIIILINIGGCIGVYLLLNKRQVHFMNDFCLYSGWSLFVTLSSAILMLIPHPSRYVRATRVVKAGMLGCLIIYLFLSL